MYLMNLLLSFSKILINITITQKKKYLEKKLTYNSFITVIRQICNHLKITYTSQVKYDKSVYDIIYYIYF